MSKIDLYQKITDDIMTMLSAGTIPWRQGWQSSGGHKNLLSGKAYRGINPFLLEIAARKAGYSKTYWLSYKQAASIGGQVRKGEKSSSVIFWKMVIKTDKNNPEETKDSFPFLRYYNVFNADQIDGISDKLPKPPSFDFTPIEQAENIINSMPNKPELMHATQDCAYYSPTLDRVTLPEKTQFYSPEDYYSVAFHELSHSTGNKNRLNRKSLNALKAFSDDDYSQEELVAEFGAAFLCGQTGIIQPTINNSAAYIQGWLKALKNDKKLAIIAAAQGQKAADYIMGIKYE